MVGCPILLEGVSITYLWPSDILEHIKVHSTCHCFSRKKNGLIIPALVNSHYAFNLGYHIHAPKQRKNFEIPKYGNYGS
jgi:hypothetical protein